MQAHFEEYIGHRSICALHTVHMQNAVALHTWLSGHFDLQLMFALGSIE